jgi:2-dehydropantoate 2-reductase
MKICIVGAGAIGGFIGTKLAATGAHQVSALARGVTLAALQQHGWRLSTAEGLVQAPLHMASNTAADLGVQDLIIIAVKSQSLADVAPTLAPLIGNHTLILPAMNGVPWWFMQNQKADGLEAIWDKPLQSTDPTGLIQKALPANQVIGCVVHASTSASSPGLAQHHGGQKLIVGEPLGETDGASSARVSTLVQALSDAGFEAVHSKDIRHNIWYKLWGNMTMNPVSAITGATIDRVLGDKLVRNFCSSVMLEAQAIGARIGCVIDETPEDRHAVTSKLGAFKTSMLQDVEAGRAIELDAIVGAVREMGERLEIHTPNIDALLGLTRLLGQSKHIYKIEK